MGASITLAGEDLIAQKQAASEGLDVARFIFANVPGLDHSGPVDRAAGLPDAGQIVYTATIPTENKGYVNPSQVVYSVQVGSDVGDWDFNWIGLESAESVLFAVSYVPLQQKRRNLPPLQVGNNLTRNFLLAFDGAQALTGITIDASTWQHDFTVRLTGIDERERLSNREIFGRAGFFGNALQLTKVGDDYQLQTGIAYVEGIRLVRHSVLPVPPPPFLGNTAWLDVSLKRELSNVVASMEVVWGANQIDYIDSAGVQHYCVPIAYLPDGAVIIDQRLALPIYVPLVEYFAARVGDYPELRARATTKDDVGLGNLPNAKSNDPANDSSDSLATSAAVKSVYDQLNIGAPAGTYFAVWINDRGQVVAGSNPTTLAGFGITDALRVGMTSQQRPSLASPTAGTTYQDGALEIREAQLIETASSDSAYAPAISFHWGGMAAKRLLMDIYGDLYWGAAKIYHAGNLPLTGAVQAFLMPTPPSGWLKANGAAVSRTAYAELFVQIGTNFGAGDGSTTFNLPDLRGEFIRGWDDGRGIDPGRGIGSVQLDELKSHQHDLPADTSGASDIMALMPSVQADEGFNGTHLSAPTGGTETRPRNVALLYCIKY